MLPNEVIGTFQRALSHPHFSNALAALPVFAHQYPL